MGRNWTDPPEGTRHHHRGPIMDARYWPAEPTLIAPPAPVLEFTDAETERARRWLTEWTAAAERGDRTRADNCAKMVGAILLGAGQRAFGPQWGQP